MTASRNIHLSAPYVSSTRRKAAVLLTAIVVVLAALLLAQQIHQHADGAEPKAPKAGAPAQPAAKDAKPADPYAWRSLFDGKTMAGWKVPNFGGEGEVKIEEGSIVMEMGNPMSGIVCTAKIPNMNYELILEGRRILGNDFFCTTTFPVGESPCSLVVGGWGGTVVGLSCIDFYDASDNPTTQFLDFKTNQWYRVRIRVTESKIEAWIDDEQVVNQETAGHRISIRDEVDLCRPLGVATWCTAGAVRGVRIRKLTPEEEQPLPKDKQPAKEKPAAEAKK